LTNGDFSVANPAAPGFAWTTRGNASVDATGKALLGEGGNLFADFSQTFSLPAGATHLRFTLSSINFTDNGVAAAPDAFEVALLNANTLAPAAGVATSLADTDSLLNIQSDGRTFFAPKVSIGGLTVSGQTLSFASSLLVDIDVLGIAPGTPLTLYFDFLGLGLDGSSVAVDDVTVLGGIAPPSVTFQLDPTTDSGTKGDNLTNFKPINIIGTTDALQTVMLDIDGDGFDDGMATADATGHFVINGVVLTEGPNALRVQAANAGGSTIASGTVTLDSTPPALTIDLAPASDTGILGDHSTTNGIVTLTGVTEPGLLVTLQQTGATTTAGADGSFQFANVALVLGSNTFTVLATDAAANTGSFTQTFTRTTIADTDPPVIDASLVADTGASATDRVTSNAAIRGTVTDASAVTTFIAGLDAMPLASFVNVLPTLTGTSFLLSRAMLEQILGSALSDGLHTLHLRAADDKGNTSAIFDFSFTLDTHSPTILPPARVNPGQIQRSRIDRIEFDLSEDLATTLLAGGLRLVRNGAVSTPLTGVQVSFDHQAHRVAIDMRNVVLPDGDYELQVLADGVADLAGNTLDIDGDNIGDAGTGKFISIGFFKLTGDANADRVVNAFDMLVIRKALGATSGQLNFSPDADLAGLGDGAVNDTDMAVVTSNLGHTVQPLTSAKLTVLESSGTPNDRALDFGQVTTAATPQPIDVVLRNDGQQALTIASIQIVGANAGEFSFEVLGAESGTTGLTILAGQSKTIRIRFTPGASGARSAQLRFWSNDPATANPVIVTLAAQTTPAPGAPVVVSSDEVLVRVYPTTTPVVSLSTPVLKPVAVTPSVPVAPLIVVVSGDERMASVHPATTPVVTAPAPIASPTSVTSSVIHAKAPARPAPVKHPPVPASPPVAATRAPAKAASSQKVLTARLVATSSAVVPPNRLFASGKSAVVGASDILRSSSAPVLQTPVMPPRVAVPSTTFNTSGRIRLASGSTHSH
jgi:hypothetical protein